MKKQRYYIYSALLSIFFLFLITITAIFFSTLLKNDSPSPQEPEYIYVYLPDSETESKADQAMFLVKEQNGKIGIYDAEGKLIKIIDTHIKTLPEAERSAIKEGFNVTSEKELYDIIEAYTD